jgi:chromosome segregation protein
VLEQITVDRGFETALGAALGEDLDAYRSIRGARPTGATHGRHVAAIPRCRTGVRQPRQRRAAPRQLARRLAQIGVVEDIAEGGGCKRC